MHYRNWDLPYQIHQFALLPQDRSVLHERIEQRFDLMLQQGLIEEVTALKQRPELNLDLPSMRSVGYRQVWEYLNNDYDYDEMRFKGVVATRQLAKRQYTWFSRQPPAHWPRHDDIIDNKNTSLLIIKFQLLFCFYEINTKPLLFYHKYQPLKNTQMVR